jgi:hypothetical protein
MTFRGHWNVTGSMTTERGNRLYWNDKVHIHRVPQCMSPRRNGDPPLPLPKEPKGVGGGTLAYGWGCGESQFQWLEKKLTTLSTLCLLGIDSVESMRGSLQVEKFGLSVQLTTEYGCYIRGYVRITNKELKPNSWTYNFVEVSEYDLDSFETWGFREQCSHYKQFQTTFAQEGKGVKSVIRGDCE